MDGRSPRRQARDQGAAAVEFAFVVIPLLYLVLGIISYAYMLSFRQTISQAASEGARAIAVSPASLTTAARQTLGQNAVSDAMGSYGIACNAAGKLMKGSSAVGDCSITIAACTNDTSKMCASVAVNYDYANNPLIPVPGLGIVTPNRLAYTAVAQAS